MKRLDNQIFKPSTTTVKSSTYSSKPFFDDRYKNWKFMYSSPPTDQITLEQFEAFSYSRLRLLRLIDNWKIRGFKKEEMDHLIREEEKKIQQGEEDVVGHHILRLAFSQNESLRKWFISQECTLFEFRLQQHIEDPKQYIDILNFNGIHIESASIEEKHKLHLEEQTLFFKVNFEEVLQLVSKRKVVLKKGKAYVSIFDLTSLLVQHYRQKLSESLNHIFKSYPFVQQIEKDRLAPLLTQLGNMYLLEDEYKQNNKSGQLIEKIENPIEQVEVLSKESFPLCMRNLQIELKKSHHLKHLGRMQYGLFLKAIGVQLEQALQFWQYHFTQSMSVEDFLKNHAYNIRHNYGQEGKKTNYSPYGCVKIIMGSAPGVSEHHGCPFRHFDEKHLRDLILTNSNTSNMKANLEEIIHLVHEQHYQIACRKYFDVVHQLNTTEASNQIMGGAPMQHPNRYFEESRKWHKQQKL